MPVVVMMFTLFRVASVIVVVACLLAFEVKEKAKGNNCSLCFGDDVKEMCAFGVHGEINSQKYE